VLAVVTHFHGDIQAANLHLLTQPANASHNVLNNWTPEEMAVFHAVLLQQGKIFPQVVQHQGVRNSNLLFIFFTFSFLYFSFFTLEIGFSSSENKRVGRGWGGGGVCSRAPFF
jgi:hypothetical protein